MGDCFQKRDPENLKTVPYVGLFEKNLTLSGTTDPKKVPCPAARPRIKFWGSAPPGGSIK